MRRISILITLSLLVTSCSGNLSLQGLGESVLSTVGVDSGMKSYVDAGQHLVKATQKLSREEEYYLGRAVAAMVLAT